MHDGARFAYGSVDRAAQIAATAAVAGLCLYWHRSWQPGFDEWWHVFLSEVRPLPFALGEIRQDSHPPLLYLLLRPLSGLPPGWLRAPSVLLMVFAVPVLHRIGSTLRLDPQTRHAAVLAIVLSPAWISMALSLRGYGYMLFLLLLGIASLLGALRRFDSQDYAPQSGTGRRGRKAGSPDGFWLCAGVAAPWFVAGAMIPFAALLLALALLAGVHGGKALRFLRPSPGMLALLLVHGVVLAAWLRWSVRQQIHLWLGGFLKARGESPVDFVRTKLGDTWELFFPSPADGWSEAIMLLLIAGSAIAAGCALLRRDSPLFVSAAALPVCVALLIAASLDRRYPLGGQVRHQSFLLPLIALSPAWIALCVPARRVRHLVAAGLLLLAALNLAAFGPAPGKDEFSGGLMWEGDAESLLRGAGPVDSVLCDAYTHVGLFAWARSRGGDWRHEGRTTGKGADWDAFSSDAPGWVHRVERLSRIWKWGALDAEATVARAAEIVTENPQATIHIYVRDPDPVEGGASGDPQTRALLVRSLERGGLRILEILDLKAGWILRAGR